MAGGWREHRARLRVLRIAILAMVAAVLGLAVAIAKDSQPTPLYTAATSSWTGEDLVRGVVFGEGPVGRLLADVFPVDVTHSEETRRQIEQTIDILHRDSSWTFDELRRSIGTHNPFVIGAALGVIGPSIVVAASEVVGHPITLEELRAANNTDAAFILAVVAVTNFLLLVNGIVGVIALVTVNVGVSTNFVTVTGAATSSSATDNEACGCGVTSLAGEEFLAEIAERL